MDAFCQVQARGSKDSFLQCEQYYAQQKYIEPPDASGIPYLPASMASSTASGVNQLMRPANQRPQRKSEVPVKRRDGTFVVAVTINAAIQLAFFIDSGATDVSIPADVVRTLMRAGTISDTDFLGKQTYTLADGSTVPSVTFRIRSLRVGDTVLDDVTASVGPVSGSLLLGQSFLSRVRSWSIDNERQVLILDD